MDWGFITFFAFIFFGSILRPELGKQSVVIVDDDVNTLHLLERILTKLAFDVHTFSNHKEALERATFIVPDILIFDIPQNNVEGQEFIGNMFTLFPELQVIITGDYNQDIDNIIENEHLNQFHKHEKIPYLYKPFGYNELRSKLIKLIQ